MLSLCLTMGTALYANYTGRVYVDQNRNGRYDRGETTLSGVMVTDGLHVVKTNEQGLFDLPGHESARFITVTTPNGYKPADVHYLPIKEGVESYDLGLLKWERADSNGKHSFIQITDTEIRDESPEHKLWAHNVRDYAQNEKSAFVIHTGDICYEGGLKAHIKLMNSKNMGVPMYYTIGNHDLVKGDYGEQLFESIYGPVWYSFNYGNVHYIVTPMPGGDHLPSYREKDVYAWLKNDLAHINPKTPIVVFNHDLLSNNEEFVYKKDLENRLVLNKEYNLKAWLYGHWHNHFVRMQGDVKTISTATLDKGGIDHSTSAYRVMQVDGKGNMETQLRYAYINKHVKIASIANERAALNPSKKGILELVVNSYYSDAETKSVSYKITSSEQKVVMTQAMKRKTDWTWHSSLNIPKRHDGEMLFVEVVAQFSDGTSASAKEAFVFNSSQKFDLQPTKDWTNLLENSSHVATKDNNDVKFPLHLSWVKNVAGNLFMSSPIVYNGNVYVATVDEELRGEGAVIGLDGKTGEQLWRYQTRNSVKNTIVAEAGNIYAQDAEGYLYAINAKTGKLSWEKQLEFDHLPVIIEGLASKDGILYAGTGKVLGAYDAKSGEPIWTNNSWSQNQGATSSISVNDDVLLMGAQWSALFGHDAKTGEKLWSLSKYGLSNRGATPALYGDVAYLLSSNSLFILDAKRGEILLKKELPYNVDATSTPLVTEKLIIFGTVDNGLIALDKESYEQEWKVTTKPALVYSSPYSHFPANTIETSPVLVDNMAVFGASDGIFYGVNIDTGKVLWMHETGAPIFSTVAISGNVVYGTDFGGNVYAFSNLNR